MKKAYKLDLEKPALKKKKQELETILANMKKYKTVALLKLTKLPDSLFQKLRKDLRKDGGMVKVLKKAVVQRMMEKDKNLKTRLKESEQPIAIILTNKTPYELNKFFKSNKKRRAAKMGDVAPFDLVVPAGDTDLPPGPALSELKAGGLNVQIKAGKIVIAKDSTVAKKGEAITEPKVKALQKLNVMPFEIRASMLFGYDWEYIYDVELLDIDETLDSDLKKSLADAMNFSLNAKVPTSQNIDILLGEAYVQAVSMAANGGLYSSGSIESLLATAARQGLALNSLNAEAPKEQKV